jgi:hypothetical protein
MRIRAIHQVVAMIAVTKASPKIDVYGYPIIYPIIRISNACPCVCWARSKNHVLRPNRDRPRKVTLLGRGLTGVASIFRFWI